MKKLADLNPKFIGLLRSESGEGISFDCPSCGPTHRIAAYFKNPIDGNLPASWHKLAWERDGSDFATLTLAPSIKYDCWHGWIEVGHAIDMAESPVTVVMEVDGELRPVNLSPMQAINLSLSILNKYGVSVASSPVEAK